MTLAHHLQLLGVFWLLLAALNVFVIPKRFGWKTELERLTLFTRQVFQVHCLFIVLVLILMGTLSLGYTHALLEPSPLARAVLFGLMLFWGVRLLVQWFVYDRQLWRGNRFHTTVHLTFTGLWTYATGVYAWAWWTQLGS